MSRRSPARSWSWSQDSFRFHAMALKVMLPRQVVGVGGAADGRTTGPCPAWTGGLPVPTFAFTSALAFVSIFLSPFAGAIFSLACFSFTDWGGCIRRTAWAVKLG